MYPELLATQTQHLRPCRQDQGGWSVRPPGLNARYRATANLRVRDPNKSTTGSAWKSTASPDRYHLPPLLAAYSLGTTLVGPTSVVTQASVSREEELQSVSLSVTSNSATLWIVALQAPLSMGFSRQEYWNGLSFPSPRDLPNPGLNPGLLHGRQIIYSLSQQGSPKNYKNLVQITQI